MCWKMPSPIDVSSIPTTLLTGSFGSRSENRAIRWRNWITGTGRRASWQRRRIVSVTHSIPCYRCLSKPSGTRDTIAELFQDVPIYDTRNVDRGLDEGTRISCPRLDADLISTYPITPPAVSLIRLPITAQLPYDAAPRWAATRFHAASSVRRAYALSIKLNH